MKSPKFYKTIIVALVILNISTLAFIWLRKPPHPPKPGEVLLTETLKITGDSKATIDVLEKDHHKTKKNLVNKDLNLHEELYATVGSGNSGDSLLNAIAINKEEIEMMTFKFFDEVASHCDDDQKLELDKMIREFLDHLRPGPPRPPRD